ncbi:protein transport protein Sec16A isoform X2 [Denticeps clupeoides]|uniref:protein transport protein Sec16A isoform X2 n=1 Tax=Denticeps clupeoides TaxID=299321 RepID=UPI0010A48B70|nr:protein transport protein Sec16A isoform X2 [Denticeps clupeoides]
MQPPPRMTTPGAAGAPPAAAATNAFRRNRPHKHASAATAMSMPPPTQPMTDPFAFGRQGPPPLANQGPPPISSPFQVQVPPPNYSPLPVPAAPPEGLTQNSNLAQAPPPPPSSSGVSLFSPQPPPSEQAYFNSTGPHAYNSHNASQCPPAPSAAPPQGPTPFQPPAPSHWMPDNGSRPPSVQNYFQPTSDHAQPFPPPQMQPPPHVPSPQSHMQNLGQSFGASVPQQPNFSPFPVQNYFSQAEDPATSELSEPGALSMFFSSNDVENEETLAGDGRVNGISYPPHTGDVPEPCASGGVAAQFDSVENQECVPNQEVLPSEPQGPAYEAGPNLETPDPAPRPARSASVSSSYSNISHGSGHAPHAAGHIHWRQQGVVGTFIQQESPRPPDPTAPLSVGYFEQIDSAPGGDDVQFPAPSPPKLVGFFQASANSSFEPVRSHAHPPLTLTQAQHVPDRARVVAEKGGAATDALPGNLEQPPDNMETLFPVGVERARPGSRAHGSRRVCDSPATTLWAPNDAANLGANILLAPAAPPLAPPFAPPRTEVIQPPEEAPLDLQHNNKVRPPLENLENPPDPTSQTSLPQASLGYASLLVSTPPNDALNQPVLIAPPSSNCSVIPAQSGTNQISPKDMAPPIRPPSQGAAVTNLSLHFPSSSFNPPSNQGPLNLRMEGKETPPSAAQPHPPLPRDQSTLPANVQASPSAASNQNQSSNYELLDFSLPQSLNKTQPSALPPSQLPPLAAQMGNAPGFYLQVTKDAQPAARVESEPTKGFADPLAPAGSAAGAPTPSAQTNSVAPTSTQHPPPSAPAASVPPPPAPGPVPSSSQAAHPPGAVPPTDPPRPPSAVGGMPGYGPPPPVPGYGGYYGYPEYSADGRPAYPPSYPMPDPRAQQYYQDELYRRADPRYSRYDANSSYREAERQPDRPSSRSSQYSDRPHSRQGYDDYHRPPSSAYDQYYADYYKNQYDYGDRSRWYDPNAAYDPRYRGYYDQSYGWYYDSEAYRRGEAYYNQQYPNRREGYDDPWRYYPGYDASFDEDYRRQREPYSDEFDRRSVNSERSSQSVRSHSTHSRRNSFSSRSQQSQVYRSQPDLVAAAYDPTASTMPLDYTYRQYPEQPEYTETESWPTTEQAPPRPLTPEKFSVPHRCARFGPSGQLIMVLPNLPSAGQPALVELHNMETLMQDSQEQAELRAFPGPLIKEETHKVDVIKFAQNKAQECMRNDDLIDKESAYLIWEFIVLLCRQNGTVVGTDIADLLLREHRSVWLPGKSPNEANLIDFNNEALERPEEEEPGTLSLLSDTFMTVPDNVGKETERFRELLLFGRKKDALESAMKNGLWGHALLLASKMDNRTHARVMTRFANSLPINDPLQTVYQLMSGRMPAAATCCGDEKWGDWRPHLAMILSNLTHALDLDTRTITTMGDTLASKGLVDAAHFCYLMAQVGLGVYTKKSTKMVLLGSNHSLPFVKFCSSEAIQRTEAFEYAQSLGSQPLCLPNFQVFKFVYACRLAEVGLCAQAFHYCEVISRSLLSYTPYHSPVFTSQLIEMSARLRFCDPQLKEKPEQELFVEPDWLLQLRNLDGQIKEGVISLSADRGTPQLYPCSSLSSEEPPTPPDQSTMTPDPSNPFISSMLPGPPLGTVQLMPPAPPTILQEGAAAVTPPQDGMTFYPVPPTTGIPGYPPNYQPEQQDCYPPMPTQTPPQMPLGTHPQVPGQVSLSTAGQIPGLVPGQMPPPMPGQMPPPMPGQMPPPMPGQMPPPMPGQMPPPMPCGEAPVVHPSPQVHHHHSPQMDFYDQMANLGPGRRSRTTSQSSVHTLPGRRSRTTSESSNHSVGRERSSSTVNQGSPPPPPIPEAPPTEDPPKRNKKDSPKKGGGGWLNWLYPKKKNEAHLPDDKNKSIIWDEKKQRWVNTDEPEEEYKPPPPPPSFPKMAPSAAPGMGQPVNIFSRKAGTKNRYVDVLNPGRGGGAAPPSIPPPADLFAPLAPMPMQTNLFTPSSAPNGHQHVEDSLLDSRKQSQPQMFNPAPLPPGPEGTQSGELSRSSSMSSLSREVSQHLNQAPAQAPPSGGVTFYNPAQFVQNAPVRSRVGGRLSQREYPTLK